MWIHSEFLETSAKKLTGYGSACSQPVVPFNAVSIRASRSALSQRYAYIAIDVWQYRIPWQRSNIILILNQLKNIYWRSCSFDVYPIGSRSTKSIE